MMKYKSLIISLSVILLLSSGVAVSVPLGNGCIKKYVYLDGQPLEGAHVWIYWGGRCIWDGYTNADGYYMVCELGYGNYLIDVDWDNDGTMDTVGEQVVLDSPLVVVENFYDSPTNVNNTAIDIIGVVDMTHAPEVFGGIFVVIMAYITLSYVRCRYEF